MVIGASREGAGKKGDLFTKIDLHTLVGIEGTSLIDNRIVDLRHHFYKGIKMALLYFKTLIFNENIFFKFVNQLYQILFFYTAICFPDFLTRKN